MNCERVIQVALIGGRVRGRGVEVIQALQRKKYSERVLLIPIFALCAHHHHHHHQHHNLQHLHHQIAWLILQVSDTFHCIENKFSGYLRVPADST